MTLLNHHRKSFFSFQWSSAVCSAVFTNTQRFFYYFHHFFLLFTSFLFTHIFSLMIFLIIILPSPPCEIRGSKWRNERVIHWKTYRESSMTHTYSENKKFFDAIVQKKSSLFWMHLWHTIKEWKTKFIVSLLAKSTFTIF